MRACGRADEKRRVQCVGRAERETGDEPTFYAYLIEDQIGNLLRRFVLPASDLANVINAWRHAQSRSVDVVEQLRRKLDRLKQLHLEGDPGDEENREEKARTTAELDALPKGQGIQTRRLEGGLPSSSETWPTPRIWRRRRSATDSPGNSLLRSLWITEQP
jgi:hypothetical protein